MRLLLIDGPPGIGCPVIAASVGVDIALVVTEPTVAGVHDLQRVLNTMVHFRVSALVLINKADLNLTKAQEIESFCVSNGIEVVGRIPFDTVVTEAMVHAQPVTVYSNCPVSIELRHVWKRIELFVVSPFY